MFARDPWCGSTTSDEGRLRKTYPEEVSRGGVARGEAGRNVALSAGANERKSLKSAFAPA